MTIDEACPGWQLETTPYPNFGTQAKIEVPIDAPTALAISDLLNSCKGQVDDKLWSVVAKWSDENLWPALYGWV